MRFTASVATLDQKPTVRLRHVGRATWAVVFGDEHIVIQGRLEQLLALFDEAARLVADRTGAGQ